MKTDAILSVAAVALFRVTSQSYGAGCLKGAAVGGVGGTPRSHAFLVRPSRMWQLLLMEQ